MRSGGKVIGGLEYELFAYYAVTSPFTFRCLALLKPSKSLRIHIRT